MLTIFISIYAGLIAIPLGILLALGRQSQLPVIRMISVIFIEFWRGVPIVAVIFLASILLPLIMPSGVGVDRLARAVIGLGLVIAAYMAEAVRGGLQAVPRASTRPRPRSAWATGVDRLHRAAAGHPHRAARDDQRVHRAGEEHHVGADRLDLGPARHRAGSLADPNWVGMNKEAYAFAGLLYWLGCFGLSRVGIGAGTQPVEGRAALKSRRCRPILRP